MACSITLINHATVFIQVNGLNILTDPIWSMSISFVIPRLKPPGIPFDELPHIHLILLSHSDYDHLNFRTLRRLRRRDSPAIILPRGLGTYGSRLGFKNVVELDPWSESLQPPASITCVPAQHSGSRILWDRTPACGFVVQSGNETLYFSGDTGYGEFFKEIARMFTLDIAMLPIGAYKPHEWFKNIHLRPTTALQAFLDLEAKHLIPIHWGTFKISDEPMWEPPLLLEQGALELGIRERVHILDNGETFGL
jgi:L-ascorbate metabolism protein UlaG (beta-lactamase superfamily)